MQNNTLKRSDLAAKAYKNYDRCPFRRQQCPLPFDRLGSKLCVYMITGVTLLLLVFPHHSTATESSKLEVVLDVSDRGKLGDIWLETIEDRHTKEEYNRLRETVRPISRQENEWYMAFKEVIPDWIAKTQQLHEPFPGVNRPMPLTVIFANQGGDDGFSFRTDRIGIDLSKWVSAYGTANEKGNDDRIKRILSHEYTHLLTRAWMKKHPYPRTSFKESALYDLFHEGLGHFYSLSEEWVSANGQPTDKAKKALRELTPIFRKKIEMVFDGQTDPKILEGMTSGPFRSKWGALPVALWLSQETKRSGKELRKWVAKGPDGILELGQKYAKLTPKLSITNLGLDFLNYWSKVKEQGLKSFVVVGCARFVPLDGSKREILMQSTFKQQK